MPAEPISLESYRECVGQTIGVSHWLLVDQERINGFARVTEDEQFIHVDPASAARSPYGGTIAHGFLTLSLLSVMSYAAIPSIADAEMTINYGLNNVRFVTPVGAGRRIRGVFLLRDLRERDPDQWQSTLGVTVEIEASEKPAIVAEWITLAFVPRPDPDPFSESRSDTDR